MSDIYNITPNIIEINFDIDATSYILSHNIVVNNTICHKYSLQCVHPDKSILL